MSFLKDYEPVEERLAKFWADHPQGRVLTEQEPSPESEYIFVARVYREPGEDVAASGWAHESVAQLPANMKASALEVCETSAIGRALANLGYAPRGKRPSREEMASKASAAHQPGETTGTGVQGRENAADDGKGSAPTGEAGAGPKPSIQVTVAELRPTDLDDRSSLIVKAAEALGGTNANVIVKWCRDKHPDWNVAKAADLAEYQLRVCLDEVLPPKEAA